MDSPIEITFFIQIESVWKDERSKEPVLTTPKLFKVNKMGAMEPMSN